MFVKLGDLFLTNNDVALHYYKAFEIEKGIVNPKMQKVFIT